MKEALTNLINNVANLLKVKSLVTIALTYGMILLLSGKWNPSETIIALYSTVYGAIITYFFTKDDVKKLTTQVNSETVDVIPVNNDFE